MRATERDIQEVIARCVAGIVYYRNSQKTPQLEEQMATDAASVAAWLQRSGLQAAEVDAQVLRPVEAEVIARFGRETGLRLSSAFAKAVRKKLPPGGYTPLPGSLIGPRL
jgi:hypothetical protein